MVEKLDSEWLHAISEPPPVEWPVEDSFEELSDFSTEIPNRERQMGALAPTWWLLDEEATELSNVMDRAGESLNKFFDFFKVYPINFEQKRKLFAARYEFPQFGKGFQHSEAVKDQATVGIIDFLTGFPMASTEILAVLGQYSSREERVDRYSDPDSAVPPIPDEFFEGYAEGKYLLNRIYLEEDGVETLADPLAGEGDAEGLHWWCRINVKDEKKYPIPGEFFCLINRPWCVLPWGEQESSPYIFSGEWMDTIYYTGAVVKEVLEGESYPTYVVEWRKQRIEVRPTDFADYNKGDFVTILKTVPNLKESQMWHDKDTKEFDEGEWVIAPLMFYGFKGIGAG